MCDSVRVKTFTKIENIGGCPELRKNTHEEKM